MKVLRMNAIGLVPYGAILTLIFTTGFTACPGGSTGMGDAGPTCNDDEAISTTADGSEICTYCPGLTNTERNVITNLIHNGDPLPTCANAQVFRVSQSGGGAEIVCGACPGELDAGNDGGSMQLDAGSDGGSTDAGSTPVDAGTDGGSTRLDAGSTGVGTQLVFTTQPPTLVTVGATMPAVVIQVEDAQGNLVTVATGTVTISLGQNGGGTANLSGTLMQPLSGGVATFTGLSVSADGTGDVLEAAFGALTPVKSDIFNVVAGSSGAAYLASCEQDTDCSSDFCTSFFLTDQGFPGPGFCSTPCTGDTQCPTGSLCALLPDSTGTPKSGCLPTCSSSADCASEGAVCDGLIDQDGSMTIMVCFVKCPSNLACNNWEAGTGESMTCESSGVCD